jgi:hypothetical protein
MGAFRSLRQVSADSAGACRDTLASGCSPQPLSPQNTFPARRGRYCARRGPVRAESVEAPNHNPLQLTERLPFAGAGILPPVYSCVECGYVWRIPLA